jgi:hypothetical protein
MTDFRKWFLAFAVLVVMVGTAYAQTQRCTQAAVNTPRVRAEGRAELVGDVLLQCTGEVSTTITANIMMFLNTNITSRVLSTGTNLTEALLAINEPAAGSQILQELTPVANANIWRGQKISDKGIMFWNVQVPIAPGTNTWVRITNVRANAVEAQPAGGLPGSITFLLNVQSGTPLPITIISPVIANTLLGLTFDLRKCDDSGGIGTGYTQCAGAGESDLTKSHSGTGLLKFTEGFDSAYKVVLRSTSRVPYADLINQDGQPLGYVANSSESGYVNSLKLGTRTGVADTGTRLLVRFANIPTGVRLFVTVGQTENGTTKVDSTLTTKGVLVSVTDPTGTSGSVGYPVIGTVTYGANCGKSGTGDSWENKMAEVPLYGGAGSATWEITKATTDPPIETVAFGIEVQYSANPQSNLPALTLGTPGTVSGNLAPISADATMSYTAPIPRFIDGASGKTLINIDPCVTNLLFPFVTARAGFDTGIAISNTTLDNSKDLPGGTDKKPFNTKTQSGACTLYYFGDKDDGTSLAKPVQSSGVIAGGKQLVYTLFGGGAGIDATPGFQGYIIVTCNFQLAHGFAFISDLGAQKLAMGYLPLIIPRKVGDARPGGDAPDPERLDN